MENLGKSKGVGPSLPGLFRAIQSLNRSAKPNSSFPRLRRKRVTLRAKNRRNSIKIEYTMQKSQLLD